MVAILGLPLAEANHPVRIIGTTQLVFHIFNQHLEGIAHLGSLFVVPFIQWDRSLALETDIDEGELIVDPNDGSHDDRIDVDIGAVDGCRLGVNFVIKFGEKAGNIGFERFVIQITKEGAIDHRLLEPGKRPRPRECCATA